MWFKMCPRCEGDLYLREEIDGNDVVCIQCGYVQLAEPEKAKSTTTAARRRVRRSTKRRIAA